MAEKEKKKVSKKTVVGNVVSNKMDKTIVVRAKRRTKHPQLGKYITKRFKVTAHDQNNDAAQGDKVLVEEITRPLSKSKRWVLKKIVEKVQ